MTDAVAAAATPAVAAAAPNLSALPEGAVPSAEYAAQVLATAHGDPVPAADKPTGPQRPDHIPEKFWDKDKGEARWDDMAKSYAELEKLASGKKPEDAPADDAAPADGDDKLTIEKKKADEPAPLAAAVESFATAYAESNGEVSDEQIKSLEDLGLPRQTIDTYMAGLKALEREAVSAAHTAAGGTEKFTAAQEWAAQHLSDAELDFYNAGVNDPTKRTQTVEWLMGKHAQARPTEGKLLEGRVPTDNAGDVFRSQHEFTEAINSPEYRSNPAFREDVARKLHRSKQAGTLATQAEYFRRSR